MTSLLLRTGNHYKLSITCKSRATRTYKRVDIYVYIADVFHEYLYRKYFISFNSTFYLFISLVYVWICKFYVIAKGTSTRTRTRQFSKPLLLFTCRCTCRLHVRVLVHVSLLNPSTNHQYKFMFQICFSGNRGVII